MKLYIYSGYFDLGDNWQGSSSDALMEMAQYYKAKQETDEYREHDGPDEDEANALTPNDVKNKMNETERGGLCFSLVN